MSEVATLLTIYIVSVIVLLVGSFFVLQEERNKNGYLGIGSFFWAFAISFTPFVNTVVTAVVLFVMITATIADTKIWYKIENYKFFEKK